MVGFAAGLAQDFLMNQPKGITALTLTLVGYGVGMGRQFIVSASPLIPTVVVFVAHGGRVWRSTRSCRSCWGTSTARWRTAFKVALVTAVYGAVLTPIVYPLLRRILEGSRPRKVVRF